MTALIFDRVWETTTTTGTGSYTLAGAKSANYKAFGDVLSNNEYVEYFVRNSDGDIWERVWGQFNSGTQALTRNLIQSSTGSLIDWGSGTKEVLIAPPAKSLNDDRGILVATSRPSWVRANTLWIDSDASPPTLYWYDGTADRVVVENNSGAITSASPGRLLRTTTYSSAASGTWTRGTGTATIRVRLRGGGGGSGGIGAASGASGTGGGGQGGYSEELIDVSALASASYTVGAGGTAGATGNNAGGTGGTTSFGTGPLLQATGGAGSDGTDGTGGSGGAAGGQGSSGDFNAKGQGGGYGGSSGRGAGGGEGGGESHRTEGDGVAGANGGGAAGALTTGTTQRAGAAGGAGWIIVEEYS